MSLLSAVEGRHRACYCNMQHWPMSVVFPTPDIRSALADVPLSAMGDISQAVTKAGAMTCI